MGATRLASGIVQLLFSRACMLFFHFPDAGRIAPIRGSVCWWRLVVAFGLEETLTLMGATRLASGIVQLLFSRACMLFFHFPDARRIAPIRGSVWW